MKRILLIAAVALCALAQAQQQRTMAGASPGGNSPYATDAYPGFDDLDEMKSPQRHEPSWLWWRRAKKDTPAEQYAYAKELEAAEDFSAAVRACDALVREWPSSVEAPQAQLRMALMLANKQEDYEEAFEQLEYLFDFYARDCPYLELVEYGYKLVNTMRDKRKTWFGFSFLSNTQIRRNYESIVRRAPGAAYVPEAMLKIAEIREEDLQYEEAVKVYEAIATKYPLRIETRTAAYREARARMWLCRRLAYNMVRCNETRGFLRQTMKRYPDIEQMDELKAWLEELEKYMDEAAYKNAKSYDSRRRTPHAALAAWELFLKEHPASPHADEARARIAELSAAPRKETSK